MVKLRLVLAGPPTSALRGRLEDVFLHFAHRSGVKARGAVRLTIARGAARARRALRLTSIPRFTGACPSLDSAASLVAVALLYGYRPVVLTWTPRTHHTGGLSHHIVWFMPARFSSAPQRASYVLRQMLLAVGYLEASFALARRGRLRRQVA